MRISLMRVPALVTMMFLACGLQGRAQSPAPPIGLTSSVAGNLVTISWNPAPGASTYLVQVGTAPGASNLFNGPVGNVTSASGTVGNGLYFWRVLAIGVSGAASAPSTEAQFTVGGGGGCVAPGPPQEFLFGVAGSRVTLRWSPPASGGPPTMYVIEAGSSPGLSNVFSGPVPSTPTEVAVDAPPGIYYVRIRAQNACGISAASNEGAIQVGGVPIPSTPQPPGPGPGCSYALSPGTANVSAAGGVVQVDVSAPAGCRWQLSSDSWIVPGSSPAGSGPATLAFVVMASTGASRNGRVTIQAIDPGEVRQHTTIAQAGVAAPPTTPTPPVPPTPPPSLPTAVINGPSGAVNTNRDIDFSGLMSRAPAGRTITRYDWNCGAGSIVMNCVSTSATPRWSYPTTSGGQTVMYVVTLVVTDSGGFRSDPALFTLTVTQAY